MVETLQLRLLSNSMFWPVTILMFNDWTLGNNQVREGWAVLMNLKGALNLFLQKPPSSFQSCVAQSCYCSTKGSTQAHSTSFLKSASVAFLAASFLAKSDASSSQWGRRVRECRTKVVVEDFRSELKIMLDAFLLSAFIQTMKSGSVIGLRRLANGNDSKDWTFSMKNDCWSKWKQKLTVCHHEEGGN